MSKINKNWAAYNAGMNEGGEGYNPHQKFSAGSTQPEWSVLGEKADKIRRMLAATPEFMPAFARLTQELALADAAYAAAIPAELRAAR